MQPNPEETKQKESVKPTDDATQSMMEENIKKMKMQKEVSTSIQP